MNSYNEYEIFSGEELVATWKNNKLEVVNEKLLPLYLKRIQNSEIQKYACGRRKGRRCKTCGTE